MAQVEPCAPSSQSTPALTSGTPQADYKVHRLCIELSKAPDQRGEHGSVDPCRSS